MTILLGGPAHGQERDIANGQSELTIMAPSPGNPLPMPFKYILREIQAETQPGMVFSRLVWVEQSVPIEVATQALAQILLQAFAEQLVRQYMEGGELVDGTDSGAGTEIKDSGLLIAKR